MSRAVTYTLLAGMVVIPVVTAGFLLNAKYQSFEDKMTSITQGINQTGKASAQIQINRGLLNTSGQYQITFPSSSTTLNIYFNARHGIETIFNSPIIIQAEGVLKSSVVDVTGEKIFSSKTRYLPYYSDTEYNFSNFKIKGKENILVNGLQGNFKYTYESKDIDNYIQIPQVVFQNGQINTRIANNIVIENKIKAGSLLRGSSSLSIEKAQQGNTIFEKLILSYNNENGIKPMTYNSNIALTSSFKNNASGDSKLNVKLILSEMSGANFDKVSSSTLDTLVFRDIKSKEQLGTDIVNTMNDGLSLDYEQNIETQRIGNYNLTINSSLMKAENSKSLKDNLTLRGVFRHKGPYAEYMYNLTSKLGVAMFKKQGNVFAIDFSYKENQAHLNSNIVDPLVYLKTIFQILEQI